MKILMMVLGGAIGTLLRYGVSEFTYKFSAGIFPWGTLAVNLIGSFIIGILWGAIDTDSMSPHIKHLIFVGILGSFTTFSTFSLDTLNLWRFGDYKTAIIYVFSSVIFGISLVILGFLIGRTVS